MVSSTLRLASSSLLRSAARSSSLALPRVAIAPSRILVAAAPAPLPSAFNASARVGIAARGYTSGSTLSHQEIQNRIVEVLKSFEKVDPSKVTADAAFTSTLGLDSLDTVEVVMAIEEEFNIEIPDADADSIQTVGQAIEYISNTPEAQ